MEKCACTLTLMEMDGVPKERFFFSLCFGKAGFFHHRESYADFDLICISVKGEFSGLIVKKCE